MPPVLVYGGPSTGKTAVLRDTFAHMGIGYSYVSCIEFDKPRPLLQAIIGQLKGKKRKAADGYAGEGKAEQLADLLVHLQGMASKKEARRYLILDHVERIRDADVLAVLLRLREYTGLDMGLFLISQIPWGSNAYEFDTLRCPRPLQICFPGYRMPELLQILAKCRPEGDNERLFSIFLGTFIGPMFARCSSRIEDLQRVIEQLWPEYIRPVREGRIEASKQQQLYFAFKDKAIAAKELFESGLQNHASLSAALSARAALGASDALDFELPFTSKVLLLAAYICSRNKPALDRRLFDPSSRAGRRRGTMASDRQAEAAAEAKLRGPHAFPLERMLATFWELRSAQDEEPAGAAEQRDAQSGDLFMEISSLVSMRFLSQVTGSLSDAKYACSISDEVAEKMAKNVKVSLKEYVLYV
ncbi:hypothetical protein CVIRNUC_000462 [Coccomyxa viridis]|uniref:Origin recognition complex subunit 5 n=1 Tax=Coccomyxa viridis TaxID=1274662 RepID=A0AAV1HT71_9CHLO|nr:hypothetical protein CVIRNUC_000462 [Coccomyxa viridis]